MVGNVVYDEGSTLDYPVTRHNTAVGSTSSGTQELPCCYNRFDDPVGNINDQLLLHDNYITSAEVSPLVDESRREIISVNVLTSSEAAGLDRFSQKGEHLRVPCCSRKNNLSTI